MKHEEKECKNIGATPDKEREILKRYDRKIQRIEDEFEKFNEDYLKAVKMLKHIGVDKAIEKAIVTWGHEKHVKLCETIRRLEVQQMNALKKVRGQREEDKAMDIVARKIAKELEKKMQKKRPSPFKKYATVLVRDNEREEWRVRCFQRYDESAFLKYQDTTGAWWNMCLPYVGNEKRAGMDKPKEGKL